jgi:light-regulated signal transduction histidine kinase (bacteriophytochrome)
VDEWRVRAPERHVVVLIEPGIYAHGDARLLRVVMENLLGNAWKFTSQRDLAEITVGQTHPEDGRPAIFVRDNGAGFDMAYADKLFTAFQRLHAVQDFPGTGIGLATVSRVIGRHGGQLWADAKPERGACFYFTLANL